MLLGDYTASNLELAELGRVSYSHCLQRRAGIYLNTHTVIVWFSWLSQDKQMQDIKEKRGLFSFIVHFSQRFSSSYTVGWISILFITQDSRDQIPDSDLGTKWSHSKFHPLNLPEPLGPENRSSGLCVLSQSTEERGGVCAVRQNFLEVWVIRRASYFKGIYKTQERMKQNSHLKKQNVLPWVTKLGWQLEIEADTALDT